MTNNFTEQEIISQILYHKAASNMWLQLFNRASNEDARTEYQKKCESHCNRLLSWEMLYERTIGRSYSISQREAGEED